MSIERDPVVQRLFEAAGRDDAGEDFVANVMSRIRASRRRTIILWSCVALVLAAFVWFFTPAVVDTVDMLSRVLPRSLIEVKDPDALINKLISPLNSVAFLVAILFLGIRKIFRMLS